MAFVQSLALFKVCYTSVPGKTVHMNTILTSLESIKLCYNYCMIIIYIQMLPVYSQGLQHSELKQRIN